MVQSVSECTAPVCSVVEHLVPEGFFASLCKRLEWDEFPLLDNERLDRAVSVDKVPVCSTGELWADNNFSALVVRVVDTDTTDYDLFLFDDLAGSCFELNRHNEFEVECLVYELTLITLQFAKRQTSCCKVVSGKCKGELVTLYCASVTDWVVCVEEVLTVVAECSCACWQKRTKDDLIWVFLYAFTD